MSGESSKQVSQEKSHTLGEKGRQENDRAWRREESCPSSSRRVWSPRMSQRTSSLLQRKVTLCFMEGL